MSKVIKGVQTNQKVIYPNQEVGVIEAIAKKLFKTNKFSTTLFIWKYRI